MNIKKYTAPSGETRYKFRVYLGKDESGKEVKIQRSGFRTQAQAKAEYMRVMSDKSPLHEKKDFQLCAGGVPICKKYGTDFKKPLRLYRIPPKAPKNGCTLLIEAGASMKEVQARLGHANISTTMDIYTHLSQNKKKETVEKFVDYLAK